ARRGLRRGRGGGGLRPRVGRRVEELVDHAADLDDLAALDPDGRLDDDLPLAGERVDRLVGERRLGGRRRGNADELEDARPLAGPRQRVEFGLGEARLAVDDERGPGRRGGRGRVRREYRRGGAGGADGRRPGRTRRRGQDRGRGRRLVSRRLRRGGVTRTRRPRR